MNQHVPDVLVPQKGKRPRNRQAMIVAAASKLFAQQGFANVSMSEIADVVNVQPAALYRHFSGKRDLLRAVIAQGVSVRAQAVGEDTDDDSIDDIIARLVQSALDTQSLSSLWTIEVRLLEVDHSRELRRQIRALPESLAARLLTVRDDVSYDDALLLSWAFLDVLASISFNEHTMTSRDITHVLQDIGHRVLRLRLQPEPEVPMPHRHTSKDPYSPRRERLTGAASYLFRRRGFSAVTLEDIGGAEGISGSGVYAHFSSKQEVLDTALIRAVEWERHSVARSVLGTVGAVSYTLAALRGYTEFIAEAPDLAWMRLTETRHASPDMVGRTENADREEVSRWCAALAETQQERDISALKIMVRGSRMAALDLLSTSFLRPYGAEVGKVTQICAAILGLTEMELQGRGFR